MGIGIRSKDVLPVNISKKNYLGGGGMFYSGNGIRNKMTVNESNYSILEPLCSILEPQFNVHYLT